MTDQLSLDVELVLSPLNLRPAGCNLPGITEVKLPKDVKEYKRIKVCGLPK
jgi:hypothetical protein